MSDPTENVKDLRVQFVAYQGSDDCIDIGCRRMLSADVASITPGCLGWHCAHCHKPSSQYGHRQCFEKWVAADE